MLVAATRERSKDTGGTRVESKFMFDNYCAYRWALSAAKFQNNGDFDVSPFLRRLSDKQCRTLRLLVVIVDQNVGARHINENRSDVAFWHFSAWRDTRLTFAKGSRADIKSRCPTRTLGPHRPTAGKANTPAVTSAAPPPFEAHAVSHFVKLMLMSMTRARHTHRLHG
jgi:hypothetical protein